MAAVNKPEVMSSKPARPTIHVQLDVKDQEEAPNAGDEAAPAALRVSFSAKRSDLSLFRAASPAASGEAQLHHLAIPSSRCGRGGSTISMVEEVTGYGYIDEKVLIKSFETLANALGFKKKSFSTNDILAIDAMMEPKRILQKSQSDMHLSDLIPLTRLEANSRSLSTWVAVGDTSATTQLPSPQARVGSSSPNFTPADLIRSVNKRIRQSYLRKRVMTTYKALERMSQSGFNLDRLQEAVNEADLPPGLIATYQPSSRVASFGVTQKQQRIAAKCVTDESKQTSGNTSGAKPTPLSCSLSTRQIERDRGKPLSKFERNVMIFDWLHTLDESATADLI